jgi:glycosyltransferase involved in cell wall biosynthesis
LLRTTPINVLFVMDRLHETGGTRYYLQLLPRLDRARITPLLCAFAPRHPIASRFEAVGIEPTFFGRARWDPRCVVDLLRFARSREADLLHVEGWTSFPFGRVGIRLARRPQILRFNCMLPIPPAKAIWNRLLMSGRWPAVAVSEAVRTWAMREFAIAPDRIATLHTAIDVERFGAPLPGARERIRREFALGERAPVLGLVGRIDVAQKGQDLMIRALPALRARRPDAVLLVVGDGPDRARCEALARQLDLGDAVRFCGHRSDVAEILAAADVAVVPSVCEEAFGFVALEASATGLPVVAFASGGLPEVVVHERTGIIVPNGDVAGLSDAIARLLEDPALSRRLGDAGRRHASGFGLAWHVSAFMDLCEGVLDQHRRAGDRYGGAATDASSQAGAPSRR